jgi:tetratricopeptide (TPR) repeat protein
MEVAMHKLFFQLNYSFTILSSLLFIIFSLAVYSQTQEECIKQLDIAQQEYDLGNFEKAIELIQPCLKNPGVSESEKGRGYRLLGLVYIGKQLEKEANEAIKNLLLMVPNYKINPETDPPRLKRIIDDVAMTLEPKIISIRPNSADQESPAFTLIVNGSDFVYGSLVRFNSKVKATHYIGEKELRAEISSGDLTEEGEYEVYVYSPIMGGKTSNTEKFKVIGKSAFPWTWVGIGAGAAAVAITAIILGKGKENVPETVIAEPPSRP